MNLTTITFGLLAVVAVMAVAVVVLPEQTEQQAHAAGCINPNAPGGGSVAANASKGRCIR